MHEESHFLKKQTEAFSVLGQNIHALTPSESAQTNIRNNQNQCRSSFHKEVEEKYQNPKNIHLDIAYSLDLFAVVFI